jgi:hypothetical protein
MGRLKEIKHDLIEFCSTTSIQGMRNITDPKQGFLLQITWIIVVVTSFVLSGICIKESIDGKYKADFQLSAFFQCINNFVFITINIHMYMQSCKFSSCLS